MALSRTFSPVLHFEDDHGHPLAGGYLCTYLAGTNTPVATFSDSSGTPHNPQIKLDSRGECEVWLDSSVRYKFELWNDRKTVRYWSKDNIEAPGASGMPTPERVAVYGTSPINVEPIVSNGVTTYLVSLDQSFVNWITSSISEAVGAETERATRAEQEISGSVEAETRRATEAEGALSRAIGEETTRATAAEAAAKTVVLEGEGIDVSCIPKLDGHNEYTIGGKTATSEQVGLSKIGSDTVQPVSKEEPSRFKHRTYPVQKNADGQLVVNVPWENGTKNLYKGIATVTVEGSISTEYQEPSGPLLTEIVSDLFCDEYHDDRPNTFTVEYREDPSHPSDSKPEFSVNASGLLVYEFDNAMQHDLVFHTSLFIKSYSGYTLTEQAYWGGDSDSLQLAGSMTRTYPVKRQSSAEQVLESVHLAEGKAFDLATTYKIVIVAEYLYVHTPPEFIEYNAVDEDNDDMIDDVGADMTICEDNPEYVGE